MGKWGSDNQGFNITETIIFCEVNIVCSGFPVVCYVSLDIFIFVCNFSSELNRLIRKLEKRRRRREPQYGFTPKDRELASPSTLAKPRNCPDWASRL